MDALRGSEGNEDARNRPKYLQNALERIRGYFKSWDVEEGFPRKPRNEPKSDNDNDSQSEGQDYDVEGHSKRDGMDVTTSHADYDSPQVVPKALAKDRASQNQHMRNVMKNMLGASSPPSKRPKQPVEIMNPPHRQDELQT